MAKPKFIYAILTFVSYALIHSVRTAFSYMKVSLQQKPIKFDTQFLGQLDMTILISLAISLKTLGWIGQRIGYKLFLNIGMCYLAIIVFIIGILQMKQNTMHWVYILLYALAGIASCTGWPSCLSIVSLYYPPKVNGFKLCIWNGCSQFGDFLALGIGYLFIDVKGMIPQSILFGLGGLLIFVMLINLLILEVPTTVEISNSGQQLKKGVKSQQVLDLENKVPQIQEKSENQQNNKKGNQKKKKYLTIKISGHRPTNQVNFLNVWLLPSVTSYVLCYACLKSVNAIIMYWLYFYLNSIGINKYPKTITLSWSVSIFIGSVFMGYYNSKTINKIALLFPLGFCALIFMYLGKQYSRNSDFHYLVLMILSGLCFGGPYGLIGSTITLLLGKNPVIKQKKGALGAIISLMQGFGQFSGAFFVLIVPLIGLSRLYYLPSILCLIAGAILFIQHQKQINLDRAQILRKRQEELQLQRRQIT